MLKPPMVGRDDALRTLSGFLEDTLEGRGTLVFVSGEAGIGKTRLAEELEDLARRKGFQVLVGRCIPGAPTPYLPFQEAFAEGIKEGAGDNRTGKIIDTLRKAAPDIAGATPIIGGYLRATASIYKEYAGTAIGTKDESEKQLFNTLEFLRRLSAKEPILIRIEDLQWVDSATMQVIHYFARNAAGLRVLLVGTYRSEEVEGEGVGKIHLLTDSLRIMKREGICYEVTLKPLSREDLGMAIWGMLGNPLDDTLLYRIASESGGNPLFASEIVRLLVEAGSIQDEGGVWVAKKGAAVDIPTTVMEVALRRLERLSPEERRLLECAAVEGQYFHVGTLNSILGMERLLILEHLESLERDHQLVQPFEDDFKFNHEAICQVIYNQISRPRRKELHRVIGLSLEKSSAGPANYGLLSLHFFNGGEGQKCAEYSLLAGKGCLWQLSMPEAVIYFQRELDCSSSGKAYQGGKLQALEGLGDAYASEELARCAKALTYYEQCLAEAFDPKDRARILRKIGWCWRPDELGMGDSTRARGLLKEAESYQDLDPDEEAEILSTKFRLALYDGAWDECESYAIEAEGLFESIGAHERLAMMLVEHATIDLYRGFVQQAFEKLDRAGAINSRYPSMGAETAIATSYIFAHMYRGEYNETLKFFNRLMKIMDETGATGTKSNLVFWRALFNDVKEDFNAEMADAQQCWELAEVTESDYSRLGSTALLTHSYLRLNRHPEAQKKETEMLDLLKKFNLKMRSLTRNLIEIVQGEMCYSRGDLEDGDRYFQNGIDMIRAGYYGVFFEGVARTWFGEYLASQKRSDDAKLQYSKAIEIFTRLGNRTEVERVSRKLSGIG